MLITYLKKTHTTSVRNIYISRIVGSGGLVLLTKRDLIGRAKKIECIANLACLA